jgi:hypothetical protein
MTDGFSPETLGVIALLGWWFHGSIFRDFLDVNSKSSAIKK